jgi:hypothetical protein
MGRDRRRPTQSPSRLLGGDLLADRHHGDRVAARHDLGHALEHAEDGFSLRFVVRIGAVATPPTYVATRLVLPREAGGSVSAWIVPLDATHVSAFETEWMPELRAMGQHDVGWDWRGELNRSANVSEFELYALVAAGSGPAAIASRLRNRPPNRQRLHAMSSLRRGRVSELAADSLVMYLELLAAAPWNRVERKPKRELLCGRAMMVHAIQRSIAAGFEGRIGLHSLEDPHTHAAYRRYGMTECGRDLEVCGDDGQPELYFEFSVDDAMRFLTRTT